MNVFNFSPNKDTSLYILPSCPLGGELGAVTESARRKPKIAIGTGRTSTSISTPSHQKLHPSTYIYTPNSTTSSRNVSTDYAIEVYWTQASKVPPGWPRFCQYLPAMLCSWCKPVDWPALSAHQVGVTNSQRLHASRPCHSIATTCTHRHAVLRQAQRVALPSPQSGSMALCEANQACWLLSCLHEALPCRQP